MFAQNAHTQQKQRVSMSFAPEITNKLKKSFNEHNMQIVYKSDRKLSNLLGSAKDKIPKLQKSGIYTIKCGDCNRKYYGQTKRTIDERYKEHMQCVRLNQPNKSAVATHILIDGHVNITKDNVNLLRQVHDQRQLDAYEAFYIQKDKNALNLDFGNIQSPLFSRIN